MIRSQSLSGFAHSARCAGLVLGMAAAACAFAAPVSIPSAPTTLTSTAERMISYRQQDHMWQTSDGATHVFINRGQRADTRSLSLNSTFDGGATWVSNVAALESTDSNTTSDGYLDNDTLNVTYSGQAGDIRFAQFRYDPVGKTWSLLKTKIVFASSGAIALTPAMAADGMGRLWLAFTNQDLATPPNYSIRLMRKDPDSESWVDTGFVFGPVDNVSNERSARPVATSQGIGMVYTVHEKNYWAQRDNRWAVNAVWPRSLIYTSQFPDNDPYGSHYSVVADAQKNLHMASVDGGKVVYSRFLNATQAWTTRPPLTSDIKATYIQTLFSLDNLVIISNSDSVLRVFQSSNGGDSFSATHTLTHPVATSTIKYNNPRMEAPAQSSSPIPVLQQYTDGQTMQRAMFFAVPVVRSAPATTPSAASR